jgi:subtilisin family serine protease
MTIVSGKSKLCSCERFETYFKSVQEYRGRKLFDRYEALANIVNRYIQPEYRHFLAHPVFQGELITWHGAHYSETPRQLSQLQADELNRYEAILEKTQQHYSHTISNLKQSGKDDEADCLEKAVKFVNKDFVYCYDGKVVLGIWGMELREHVREPLGIAMKNVFAVKERPETKIEPESEAASISSEPLETLPQADPLPEEPGNEHLVTFLLGPNSKSGERFDIHKKSGERIYGGDIPPVIPKEGFEFVGWDKEPMGYDVNGNTQFTAMFREKVIPAGLPWYRRLWLWLTGSGCLRWLLYLLLLLLLLLLICWLFRTCNHVESRPIPSPIEKKPWVDKDPRAGDGGIYNPGRPYEPVPTPPEYRDVLPPEQGVLPPVDTSNLVREPGRPIIFNDRLNVLLEDENKSIMDLARKFKQLYPSEEYEVIYYDDVVKRMQILVPPSERNRVKQEMPGKVSPEFKIFIFDEALFESNFSPNDPSFSDNEKSWYLKAVKAPAAWDITKGSSSITVAVVDNGFNVDHPELKDKIVMPYNVWKHNNRISAQDIDHGTHVAGTAVATINNGNGISGIASGCALMPIQVSNEQDVMTTTSLLDGVLYALYQGADVVNMSVGMKFNGSISEGEQRELQRYHFKEEERLWTKIMDIAESHNATIVTAAGNDNVLAGVDPLKRPKHFIVVSAVDQSSSEVKKAGFSNYGNNSTVSAPGVKIYSSVGSDGYAYMDGTSMATPIVAGAVALMKSLKPELTTEQIKCILQSTGVPANGKIGNLIQIDKALQKVKSGGSSACSDNNPIPSTGDVQVLLSWDNQNDLDLACVDPAGHKVWYSNKRVPSGGMLEIDMNVQPRGSNTPIENIYWPRGGAPSGKYTVYLKHFKQHLAGVNNTLYRIKVIYGDQEENFTGSIKTSDGEVKICSFTLQGNNSGGEDHSRESEGGSPGVSPGRGSREELERERDRLRRELERIDNELRNIRGN